MYLEFIKSKAIENKYTKWYINIISGRLCRNDITEHYEIYHIVPRSVNKSYKDHCENLIKLTYREHFICHLLLSKMFYGVWDIKMKYALGLMMGKHPDNFNSTIFESLKCNYSINNIAKRSDVKAKISKALTGRTKQSHEYIKKSNELKSTYTELNNPAIKKSRDKFRYTISKLTKPERAIMFGGRMSDSSKLKLSTSRLGKTHKTCNRVAKMRNTKLEQINNMTKQERVIKFGTTKGKKWYHNDLLRKSKFYNPITDEIPENWVIGRVMYEN